MKWQEIADVLQLSNPPAIFHESDLQEWVEQRLVDAKLAAEREAYLSTTDRVDFLVEGVAVELKIDGSLPTVLRQLDRYAGFDQVDELLLVTTRRKHVFLAPELRGKPLGVHWVSQL